MSCSRQLYFESTRASHLRRIVCWVLRMFVVHHPLVCFGNMYVVLFTSVCSVYHLILHDVYPLLNLTHVWCSLTKCMLRQHVWCALPNDDLLQKQDTHVNCIVCVYACGHPCFCAFCTKGNTICRCVWRKHLYAWLWPPSTGSGCSSIYFFCAIHSLKLEPMSLIMKLCSWQAPFRALTQKLSPLGQNWQGSLYRVNRRPCHRGAHSEVGSIAASSSRWSFCFGV